MQAKEDILKAKERMTRWWAGEVLNPPAIAYDYQRPEVDAFPKFDFWHLAKHPDDIAGHIAAFEADVRNMCWGGDIIPMINLNYGPGIMAALFGCVPRYMEKTVWFEHPTPITEIVDLLEGAKLNQNNEWYRRILRITEAAAHASQGRYSVSVTDLGGVLDILASFLGPKALIVALFRQPTIIDTCRRIILDKWHHFYNAIVDVLDRYNLGCTGWLNVWCPKHWYPIQCDFAAMLSPKWFRRFVLPDLSEQCELLDYCIYHWDGPNQLQYCDDLLRIPNLTGVQWVPGVGQPPMGDDKWMPVYKKVQAAGKFIVADAQPNMVAKLYQELHPRGLFVSAHMGSQVQAEFYLPQFTGGMGGIDSD